MCFKGAIFLGLSFFLLSLTLGVGLSMDAFSVSLANGLSEPCMRWRKLFSVSGVFAFFQGLMPLTGWLCVHTAVEYFSAFEKFIPYIALLLLSFIGGKMLLESIKNEGEDLCEKKTLTLPTLLLQGVATSIDALSVGFTISSYDILSALLCAFIISAVTFVICTAGVIIGKNAGTKLSSKAGILGGVILIFIGLEIFITGIF